MLTENTARGPGGGMHLKQRYWDAINPKPPETRTADEVVSHIRSKLKGGGGA